MASRGMSSGGRVHVWGPNHQAPTPNLEPRPSPRSLTLAELPERDRAVIVEVQRADPRADLLVRDLVPEALGGLPQLAAAEPAIAVVIEPREHRPERGELALAEVLKLLLAARACRSV